MSKTLEQKNTRYLLIWLPFVLLLGSLLFYIMLRMQAHHMQEKQLLLKQQNVWKVFMDEHASMPLYIPGEYSINTDTFVAKGLLDKPRDTTLYYPEIKENLGFEILTRQLEWSGKPYQLTTYVSSREISHLVIKVFATQAFIFLLLLTAIVIINRKSSRWLWKPFFATLKTVGRFDVIRGQSFEVPQQTGITEFNQLNGELTILVDKVNRAYSNQKQFVENASHEMQTPLAIIRSKLELLINDPALTEKTAALLADITAANDRLSQMNKNLLLLAKIENNQFPQQESINISALVGNILRNYQDHYDDFPQLDKVLEPGVSIVANPALLDILFSNLIKNAVVHNIPGGYIRIRLDQNEFTIENSGHPIEGPPEQLFERFKKGNEDSKTTGLGLALVKQISQLYHIGLQYRYENDAHSITLSYNRM
jgi:signal transduction histidine kinase